MCNFKIYNINDLPEVWHKVESKTTNKYIHFEQKNKGFLAEDYKIYKNRRHWHYICRKLHAPYDSKTSEWLASKAGLVTNTY